MREASVTGVKFKPMKVHKKESAQLSSLEILTDVPWPIARAFFIVSDLPEKRGGHAHKVCEQILVCISGQVIINCSNGSEHETFALHNSNGFLVVPPGTWVDLLMEGNSTLAVLASHSYDEADYIREWATYIQFRSEA